MTPEEAEVQAARRARAGDARDAQSLQREQEAERQVTAPERRGIMATARAIAKPILALFGVRLP